MLTIETAVSSAKFVKQPGGGGGPHVFARTQSILILLGQQVENKDGSFFTNKWHKTRTAVLYKWIAQDKNSSPLQINSRRQGPQSFANEHQFAGTAVPYACECTAVSSFYNGMLTIETAVSSANLWNSRFHELWEESSSPCFARTTVHLSFAGTKAEK